MPNPEAGLRAGQPELPRVNPNNDPWAREALLVDSVSRDFFRGMSDRALHAIELNNLPETGLLLGTSFMAGTAMGMMARSPGLLRYAPYVALGAVAFDIGNRVLAPIVETWIDPNAAAGHRQTFGHNLGAMATEYLALGAVGGAGYRWGPGLVDGLASRATTTFAPRTSNLGRAGAELPPSGPPSLPDGMRMPNPDILTGRAPRLPGSAEIPPPYRLPGLGQRVLDINPRPLDISSMTQTVTTSRLAFLNGSSAAVGMNGIYEALRPERHRLQELIKQGN